MHITATHLSKRYGDKLAVDDVTFDIRPGTVTGFPGPNGAGKSTTMRLLLGLHRPDTGRVEYDGRPLTSYPNLLQVVGSLLDTRAFSPHVTARRHLQALAATHGLGEERVEEILALSGLTPVADKPTGQFSLGIGQRLGLAAAVLADPQALVLDEPIDGLDPEGVRWVRDLLRTPAGEGRTVFVSSHMMSETARGADRILVIGKGRILADAPVAELLAGGSGVRVRSPQIEDLTVHLERHGARGRAADHALGGHAAGLPWFHPHMWRVPAGAAVYVAFLALMSLALGAALRRAAPAILTVLAVLWALPGTMAVVTAPWAGDVVAFGPASAGAALYSSGGAGAADIFAAMTPTFTITLHPWQGPAILAAYLLVPAWVAVSATRRKDV